MSAGELQVVWDMDGTLIDSSACVPDAFIATVASVSSLRLSRAQVIDAYHLGPPAAMLEHFLGRIPSPAELGFYYEALAEASVAPYPGIINVLTRLAETGPVVVLTGASRRSAEILLRAAGLDGLVDATVTADAGIAPKPSPEGLRLVAARAGRPPSELAYVGDAPNDWVAARNAGCVAAAAGWGHLFTSAAETGADTVLKSPGEALLLSRRSSGRL